MTIIEVNSLSEDQKNAVFRIWNNEYPAQLMFSRNSEFDTYLHTLIDPIHTLALSKEGQVLGWCAQFWRNDRKWFVTIIDSSIQRKGIGSSLLRRIQGANETIYGWVIDHNQSVKQNGEAYSSPIDFYLKNAFEIVSSERLELDHISAVLIRWAKI